MTLRYIGKTDADFTEGRIYEAEKAYDSYYKDCYSIYDDGEDWYIYSTDFVNQNFEVIESA